jgi:hypothetical protein
MNYRELLYKFSSLPVKAFAIPVGPVKTGVPKQSPGFTASVHLSAFQISAERMRIMACRPPSKNFLFQKYPQNCVVREQSPTGSGGSVIFGVPSPYDRSIHD